MTEEAKIYGLQDIQQLKPNLEALSLVTQNTAQTSQTLVFDRDGETLYVLTTNTFPTLYHQVEDRLAASGYEITTFFTDVESFGYAMQRYDQLHHRNKKVAKDKKDRLDASGQDALEIIKETIKDHSRFTEQEFIEQLLRLSYQWGASDVHFQSEESGVVMRVRKDGLLQTIAIFTHAEWKKYLMKIKFISGTKMNIDETMQDGRFDFVSPDSSGGSSKIDVRVSVMPGLRGESVVLRFLDASKWLMTFDQIWFDAYHLWLLQRQLNKHSGLILVTGPTGSGKTTTVYSLINYLNSPDKKIITLENPVEYELPGIEQSQINEEEGYTFEEWLKWSLRHDPDIIMVWEIRTLETAEMAINAALTWHLVISTLHTNSAIESIARLVNMWVKPYMLATALNAIIGQRLVRKLKSSKPYKLATADDRYIKQIIKEIKAHNKDIDINYDGTLQWPVQDTKKSKNDKNTIKSYEWRVAVVETLDVNGVITQAIMHGKDSFEIYDLAVNQWYLTIEHNAILKVLEWETSLEEVRRHVGG